MAPALPALMPEPELITPSTEDWLAMTPEQRDAFLDEAHNTLEAEAMLAPEGVPHQRTKDDTRLMLREYFRRIGRRVYVASELSVLYPGERPFAPDMIAVLDVPDLGDADERRSWTVATEGKGLDLALEVLVHGDRRKDLHDNVQRFARLGISEYFVYDRAKQRVLAWRLPFPGATRYEAVPARLGRYSSLVLDLDLGVVEGRLRFFHGEAELPTQSELLDRVNALLVGVEARAEAEAARAEAEAARAATAIFSLQAALLTVLRLRGLDVSEAQRERVRATASPETLATWLARAETAETADDALAPP